MYVPDAKTAGVPVQASLAGAAWAYHVPEDRQIQIFLCSSTHLSSLQEFPTFPSFFKH